MSWRTRAARRAPVAQRKADLLQSPLLARCPAGADRTEAWPALREARVQTPWIRATEATDLHAQDNGVASEWEIGKRALVLPLDASPAPRADWAARCASGQSDDQCHPVFP